MQSNTETTGALLNLLRVGAVCATAFFSCARFGYETLDIDEQSSSGGDSGQAGDDASAAGAGPGTSDAGSVSGDAGGSMSVGGSLGDAGSSSGGGSGAGGSSGGSGASSSGGAIGDAGMTGSSGSGATSGTTGTGGVGGGSSGSGGTSGATGGVGGGSSGGGSSGGGSSGSGGTSGATGTGGVGGGSSGCVSDADCSCGTYSGHSYRFCKVEIGFDFGSDACVAVGMHLIRVDSAAEDAWLFDEFTQRGLFDDPRFLVWLGGDDRVSKDTWVWRDGEAFWDGGPVSGMYENFGSPPGQTPGQSDCLSMLGDGVWGARSCNSRNVYYACESP